MPLPTLIRPASVAGVALLLTATLGACGGKDEKKTATPEEAIAAAQKTLDETSGVRLKLSTPGLPDNVENGISGATGTAVSAPAFEGTVSLKYAGSIVDVPIVSVDGTVFAQLPFTTGYQDIDPADYKAPDPAGLMAGDNSFASLLPETTDLEAGKSVRGGDDNTEILTTYTGTVPGAAMKKVIPSSSGDTFAATYQITDDGELREATYVGVFYAKSDEMTYTVTFDDYGTTKEIAAPTNLVTS